MHPYPQPRGRAAAPAPAHYALRDRTDRGPERDAGAAGASHRAADRADTPVVELRQYLLRPGQRETLIELFERELIEPQEAAGMDLVGQFRDLDDPDRFVWLRAFPGMAARRHALEAFYGGPAWRTHREAANATMIDSDDVLLLRAGWPGSGIACTRPRPPHDAVEQEGGLLALSLCHLQAHATDTGLALFRDALAPALAALGAAPVACLVSDRRANDYPALPVREGENVLAWCAWFDDVDAQRRHLAALAREDLVRATLRDALSRPMRTQTLRLAPTGRSRWRRD